MQCFVFGFCFGVDQAASAVVTDYENCLANPAFQLLDVLATMTGE
jgi:4-hydroxy-3-methylbut-2-enyl diphosphate reductase IspH